jgi:hypothetical protein
MIFYFKVTTWIKLQMSENNERREVFGSKTDKVHEEFWVLYRRNSLPKGCHLDVVGGPSTPHDPESDAGGILSSWQEHPGR